MKPFRFACIFLILVSTMTLAQSNPVPLIVQPLVPASISPGSDGFTLTVHGTGFGSNAAVYWNGSIRATRVVSGSTVQAQISGADVANQGVASVTVANPGTAFSNAVYFPIRDSNLGLGFLEKDQSGIPTGPLVVGDFNNDGQLDIAVLLPYWEGPKFEVLLGKGKGAFKPPLVTSTTLNSTTAIVAGDFNGDGKLDLAVRGAGHPNPKMQVFLGKGDGTFKAKKNFLIDVLRCTFLAVAGDFNGDGNLDLILDGQDCRDCNPSLYVFEGNGDGTFREVGVGGDDGCGPYREPAIADFDGDGLLDVATIDDCGQMIVTVHTGMFQTYSLPHGGHFVAAADVNGDGTVDLVTDGVSVLLGNGDGTFRDGGGVASQGGGSINLGDFNGDGILDIAAGTSMLLGNGDGTFQDPLEFAGVPPVMAVSMGDFTGEGRLDLAGPGLNGNLAIFWQVRVYLTPVEIDFGNQEIGKTSQPQTAVLTNFSSNPLTIRSIKIAGTNSPDFAQTNPCGSGLPPNGTCEIQVTFTPSLEGFEDAELDVTYKDSGTLRMPLTGTGFKVVKAVTLMPSSLTYATQLVGTSSAPQAATLTNTGNEPVNISSIDATQPFSQLNNCPSSLPVNGSCKIQVVFSPTGPGQVNGTLSVIDDAQGSPQQVALSGVGTIVKLSPTSLNFGNQKVGTSSIPIPITLTNVGSVTLTISQIAIKGTNAADFTQTNDCGSSVPPQGHCTITVTFTPTAKGHRSAKVSISDDGGDSPQIVPLAGAGT